MTKSTRSFIIAIDGPGASGKGTLARNIGKALGFPVLDTGLLYRGVAWLMHNAQVEFTDQNAALHAADKLHTCLASVLDEPALRQNDIGSGASLVSSYPSVRRSLFDLQRSFAINPPDGAKGAVLDGRDIGTVICPDAHVKFFVTAEPTIRAERRARELHGDAWQMHYETVLAGTLERDRRDIERPIAPLKPADDATILDNSHISREDLLTQAMTVIKNKL